MSRFVNVIKLLESLFLILTFGFLIVSLVLVGVHVVIPEIISTRLGIQCMGLGGMFFGLWIVTGLAGAGMSDS